MPTERGSSEYKVYNDQEPERESLLPSSSGPQQERYASHSCYSKPRFGVNHLLTAFVAGTLACFLAQYAICGSSCFSYREGTPETAPTDVQALASPWAGSTERHNFPPANPTNAFPSLFPTSVGYAGKTPTGAEAAIVATAPSYPLHTASPQLVAPPPGAPKGKLPKEPFDLFKKWGNLSPWYSVPRTAFGVDSGPETPPTCRVTGLHLLHRHGARYPTAYASYGGPANFSSRLHAVADKWTASGELEFMNEWTYKLGEEILTPFGRQQLFDLGISTRLKYGFLLKNFTESNTIPVFRTESQDRMLASAMNFAIGFFGYPFEGQYQQSITIEAHGFNNTLAPYKTCPNANDPLKADRGRAKVAQWAGVYLAGAVGRLRPLIKGYELQVEDVYVLQQLCAYETVALGYSKFCELFTEEEWDGFDYSLDLYFWYNSAFGFALGRPLGIGYVQELVARLTHTPIATHNSSTNGTLNDDPTTFPLGQSLYVDATHEVVVLQVLTALGLSTLAAEGTLPADHMPQNRTFRARELAPFATNVHFQLLSCTSLPGPQIRVIVNDGIVPLTGLAGCGAQKDGMCSVEAFVEAQRENIGKTDWEWACHGDWDVPEEWETTTGEPPARGAR
ncbi:phosphoglycerate mutase-like protein [Mycena albidolilacea]|uniref:Phosphoglycerate mutase-like protein n=1 Tax=Mycena albidolilacea TaxID=1033008 RepID=A0AAD7AW64_9AGAR|nr:phosphoglycerate mutase-like protein [Mycena albidolilacea]